MGYQTLDGPVGKAVDIDLKRCNSFAKGGNGISVA